MHVYTGGQNQNYLMMNKASTTDNGNGDNGNDGNVFKNATDSIQLESALNALTLADDNGDGKVDRQEMANASYQLLSDPEASDSDKATGQMFATMLLGGKDGKGLFADFNDDGGVTANELTLLAKGDDDATSISTDDFKQAFGTRYKKGGNEFNLQDLKDIANTPVEGGNDPYGNNDNNNGCNNNGNSNNNGNGNGNNDPYSQLRDIMSSLSQIISQLYPGAGAQGNNGQTQGNNGQVQGNGQPQGNNGQVSGNNGQVQGNNGQTQGGNPQGTYGSQSNGGQTASNNPMAMLMQIFTSLIQLLTKFLPQLQGGNTGGVIR